MAKIKKLEVNSRGKVDDGLDFDFEAFDFEVQPPADDRHPVIKALSPIGHGAKSFVSQRTNIENFVKASLPRGYGQVYELGSETSSELKGLYNSAKEELKPVSDVAKSFVAKALPSVGDKIPKGLRERLESFSKKDTGWQPSSGPNQEERLAGLLGEIFQNQQEARVTEQKTYVEKESIRQSFEQVRHRDSMGQLDAIRIAAEASHQYTIGPNLSYQKKSLELGYRTFWALTELVKEQKEANARIVSELTATTKNTGLPDFLKLSLKENASQLMRNKFLEQARESMFGGARSYMQRFTRNIKSQASNAVSTMAGLASTVQQGQGMLEGGGLPPEERNKMLAEVLMSLPMQWASEKASKKINTYTSKNRTLKRYDAKARNFVDSIGDRIDGQLNDYNKDWGVLEGLRELLRGAAPGGDVDTRIEGDILGRQHEATPWNRQSHKSLNEIIPGLLARIHQEIRIMRTGDTNADLITYDFVKNKFSTQKAVGAGLKASFTKGVSENFQKGVSDIVSTADLGGKLTEAQKKNLEKMLAQRAMTGKSMDVSKITNAAEWGGGEDGQAIADMFARYLRSENGQLGKSAGSANRQLKLSSKFKSLTSGMADPRADLQTLANSGQLEMLRASGLIDGSDSLNRGLLADVLMGKDDFAEHLNPTAIPANAGGRKQGRSAARAQRPAKTTSVDFGVARATLEGTKSTVEHLKAIRDALEKTGGDVGGIDSSETGKAVKNIETILQSLLELTEQGYTQQLGTINFIANHLSSGEGQADGGSNFSRFVSGGFGMGKSLFNSGVAHAKGIFGNVIAPAFKKGWNANMSVAKFAKNRVVNTFNRITGTLGDVYVSGHISPALRESVMKAGGYFDVATNKVITKLEDIKGDVRDANGNIVITLEEFKSAFIGGRYKKPVLEVISGIKNSVMDTVSRITGFASNFVPQSVQRVRELAGKAITQLKKLRPAYDVYCKEDMTKPVLYASGMERGIYFSQKTSDKIKHPSEIDGQVINSKGDLVLTLEQIEKGLCDAQGRPLKMRMLRKVAEFASTGFKKAMGGLRKLGTMAMGSLDGLTGKFGDFFRNIFAPLAAFEKNTVVTNEWLEKIHNLLDSRMPGKKVLGDADGDGVRDGSLKDLLTRKEKNKEDEKDQQAKEGGDKTSFIGRMLAGITGIFGKNRNKKDDDDEEDDDDDDGFGLSDAADAADIYDAAKGDGSGKNSRGEKGSRQRRKAARKRLKNIKKIRAAKGVGKAGRIGRFLGKGMLSTGIFRTLGSLGRGGMMLGRGALGAASLAGGLGGGAMAGLGVAGKIVGGLVSWPATLAILGATGAYMAYKYAKTTKPTDLSRLRLVQYGVAPNDEEAAKKLWALEDLLEDALVRKDGRVGIDKKKFDEKEAAKIMGLNQGDAGLFNAYFNYRFVPVFINWIKAIDKYKEGGELGNVESIIPSTEKWQVAESSVAACVQAYGWRNGWSANYPKLVSGHSEVNAFLASLKTVLMKKAEKDGGPKAEAKAREETASSLTDATAQATAAMTNQDSYTVKDRSGKGVDLNTITHAELTEKLRTGDLTVSVKLDVPKSLLHNRSLNQLDALTTVRMKSYGLTEMSLSKVQQLGALEKYLEDHMTGATDSMEIGIKPEQVLRDTAQIFGISDSDEAQKNQWRYWFNGRFLPVFKTYVAAVRKTNGRKVLDEGAKLLSVGEQHALAKALIASRGVGPSGSMMSVWHNPANPWKEAYKLNDNPDSTASNIEALRLLADKIVVGEVSARVKDQSNQDLTKAAFGQYKQPLRTHLDGKGLGNNLSGIQASGDKLVGDALNASGTGTKPGSAVNLSSGGKGLKFGSVKQGVYQSLPQMTGKGWGAAKNLVLAAAQATGVDAEALAMIIAQESSFDPDATPRGYPLGSAAKGLGQHVPGSWAEDMEKHGRELGIPPGTSPFDPRASALLTAMRMRRNATALKKKLGRDVTASEAYLAHLMGLEGAESVLRMGANEIAMNSEKGTNAKRQHPEYFVARGGKAMTVAETVQYVTKKLNGKLSESGVNVADLSSGRMVTDDNPALKAAQAAAPGDTVDMQEEKRKAQGILPSVSPVQTTAYQRPAAGGAVAGGGYSASTTNLRAPTTASQTLANTKPTNPMPDVPGGITLTLDREKSEDDGIYGVLRLPDGTSFMTLELPWRDNKPSQSCIPPGAYKARRRPTTKFGFAFEILNVRGRTGILIHGGTFAGTKELGQKANSEGCILLGMGRGYSGRQKMITGYKEAMQAFYNRLGDRNEFNITIKGPDNAVDSIAQSSTIDMEAMRGTPPTAPVQQPVPATPAAATPAAAPTQAPTQQSLPRLSRPTMGIDPNVPTSASAMVVRDEALTKTIAPKLDGLQTTLNDQLTELREIVKILRDGKTAGSNEPAAATKVSPSISPAAPVQQRRTL